MHPPTHAPIPVVGEPTQHGTVGDEWAGKYVGPYLIRQKLSRGGMGEVLLGYDEPLRRHVAVKVMERRFVTDGDAIKRFEREARACAAVQNKHIANVYLVGLTEDGLPFLGMEYIDGGSLLNLIRSKTPVPFSEIARLMEEVATGLQAAHKINIIHRDIKPANIMLTKAGVVKLVDFGLAKIFFEDSYVTQEGMVLGTPSYMAPEQGRGRVVDHRADLYSLGATFYHVIVGKPPFTADSPVQIMMKHVTAPLVPMRTLNGSVPIEFDEIIGRCMRKDVDERYPDYESLLVDIKRVRLHSATRERGPVVGGQSPPSTSGSLSLPPPPAIAGAPTPPRSSQSVSVRHAPGVTPWDEQPPAVEKGLWNPATITVASVATLLVIAAIGYIALRGSGTKDDEGDGTAGTGKRPAVSLLIEKAAQKSREREDPRESPFLSYRRTVDILQSLQEGVSNFEVETGRLPQSIREIVSQERVRMNFETNEEGYPLDGWEQPLAFAPNDRQLRSAGQDRSFYNADDILMSFEGELTLPEVYAKLRPAGEK